mmetsp:Transcript_8818/g.27111  ORF Transcript_8818/g.27111 Transcript_8818/m.27111 type:complete len:361 (+) Transcript_8818:161-1243(+)
MTTRQHRITWEICIVAAQKIFAVSVTRKSREIRKVRIKSVEQSCYAFLRRRSNFKLLVVERTAEIRTKNRGTPAELVHGNGKWLKFVLVLGYARKENADEMRWIMPGEFHGVVGRVNRRRSELVVERDRGDAPRRRRRRRRHAVRRSRLQPTKCATEAVRFCLKRVVAVHRQDLVQATGCGVRKNLVCTFRRQVREAGQHLDGRVALDRVDQASRGMEVGDHAQELLPETADDGHGDKLFDAVANRRGRGARSGCRRTEDWSGSAPHADRRRGHRRTNHRNAADERGHEPVDEEDQRHAFCVCDFGVISFSKKCGEELQGVGGPLDINGRSHRRVSHRFLVGGGGGGGGTGRVRVDQVLA